MTRDQDGGEWRVSAVFDLHGTFFGDGEKSIARQTAAYLPDVDRAHAFLRAYLDRRPRRPGFALRLPLYILAQALPVWIWRHTSAPLPSDRTHSLREATGLTGSPSKELLERIA